MVVADSSPLIYLSRISALELLPQLFGTVIVPRGVWAEVVDARPHAPGVEALRHAEWIQINDTAQTEARLGLDPGETAAILLAEALRADLLLIDERQGRVVAQARGIAVRGTLGVLIQATLAGLLPALKPMLDALVSEGFRITPALMREALSRVGESVE